MYQFSGKIKIFSLALIVVGALSIGWGFMSTPSTPEEAMKIMSERNADHHGGHGDAHHDVKGHDEHKTEETHHDDAKHDDHKDEAHHDENKNHDTISEHKEDGSHDNHDAKKDEHHYRCSCTRRSSCRSTVISMQSMYCTKCKTDLGLRFM